MKTDKLIYGCAYYDEYMPYDRIEKDMELMVRAGMNTIRIAESTWSTIEPQEGVFDFTHLRRMLDAAKKYGLSVIIGTPTYAVPTWLVRKAPDILAVTHNGQNLYGPRQNMDITNPVYLHHAEILIRRLMEYVKDEPHVIGFQLDNETKSYDTCTPYAQKRFVEYLRSKFPDLDAFNREFGLDYWSNRVNDWDDFPDIRATINQSLDAEYRRFQRQLVTDFLAWQSAIVSEYKRPEQFITQNFDFEWDGYSIGLQPEVDQYQAARSLTVAGADIYHPSQDELTGCEITACGNIARGIKGTNYLVLETECQGNPEWLPYPGQIRLQAYSHIANGSNSVMYWHWHSIHNAIESYWKGVLSHDFSEGEAYQECCVIGKEWERIGEQLRNLQKRNKIAIVADNASLTGLICFPTSTKDAHRYNHVLRWLSDALFKLNIEYDIIPADEKLLSSYDCIILPAFYSAEEAYLQALDSYVKNGGNLIATYKCAFSNPHLKIYHDTQPHILHKAFGLHYDQFTHPARVGLCYKDSFSPAEEWMELLICDTAVPLCFYEHHTWNRYAAVAQNDYDAGHTLYLGTQFSEDTLIEILSDFFKRFPLEEPEKIVLPAKYPVSIKQGCNAHGHRILYLLNYSNEIQTVTNTASDCHELITDRDILHLEDLELQPWGVAILQYEAL